MNKERADIVLMLVILVLFSASVGMLHSREKMPTKKPKTRAPSSHPLDDIPVGQAYKYLHPLLEARNIHMAGKTMKGMPIASAVRLVEYIITESPLPRDQKIALLLHVAGYYAQDDAAILFALMRTHTSLHKGTPLLLVAVRNKLAPSVPALLAWVDTQQDKSVPAFIRSVVDDATGQATQDDDLQALRQIATQNITLTDAQATNLLWAAVINNRSAQFIPFLMKQGADLHTVRNKRTLLIKAVENQNINMVNALITAGADVNKFVDKAVGTPTPLQAAQIGNMYAIEKLLRKYGAR